MLYFSSILILSIIDGDNPNLVLNRLHWHSRCVIPSSSKAWLVCYEDHSSVIRVIHLLRRSFVCQQDPSTVVRNIHLSRIIHLSSGSSICHEDRSSINRIFHPSKDHHEDHSYVIGIFHLRVISLICNLDYFVEIKIIHLS